MGMTKGGKQSAEHVRRRITARLATLAAKPRGVSREWLEREYVECRRTCPDIGAELGKDPTTIHAWLRHYDIPTRPRGGATTPGSFKPGQPGTFKGKKHTPETRAAIREIRMRDGHVPYLRNGEHWLKAVAPEKHPAWKGGITPERQSFYATPEWKKASREVWARSGGRCESCDEGQAVHRDTPFHIHHIVSFMVRELRAEPSNLVLLCPDCHHWVHSRKNVDRNFLGGS